MNDKQHSLPQPESKITIQEIIQIRAILGNKDQVESDDRMQSIAKLDIIIRNFTDSLKGN